MQIDQFHNHFKVSHDLKNTESVKIQNVATPLLRFERL